MKTTLIAMWRLFHALFFYPIMFGVFLWLYFTDKHWIFGLAVLIAILVFDPIWRILGRNILNSIKSKRH